MKKLLILVMCVALLLAACGDKETPTTDTSGTVVTETTVTETTATSPASTAEYFKSYELPLPDNAQLLARGYKAGDRILENESGNRWMIVNVRIGTPGWKQVGTVSP